MRHKRRQWSDENLLGVDFAVLKRLAFVRATYLLALVYAAKQRRQYKVAEVGAGRERRHYRRAKVAVTF